MMANVFNGDGMIFFDDDTNSEFQALLDEAYSHQKLTAKLNAISCQIIELSKVHTTKTICRRYRILHAFSSTFFVVHDFEFRFMKYWYHHV